MGCCENCGCGRKVELTIDGQVIETNQFVQEFIAGAITGMLGSLRGVTNPRDITVKISEE